MTTLNDEQVNDVEGVVWMLHAQFQAIARIIPEGIDESTPDALLARQLATCGENLAETLGHYLGGSSVTLPGQKEVGNL